MLRNEEENSDEEELKRDSGEDRKWRRILRKEIQNSDGGIILRDKR